MTFVLYLYGCLCREVFVWILLQFYRMAGCGRTIKNKIEIFF